MKTIVEQAFEKMSYVFTTEKFYKECRKLGIDEENIKNQSVKKWLIENTKQMSERCFRKESKTSENEIKKAINLLKNNGYKIQKLEWVNI